MAADKERLEIFRKRLRGPEKDKDLWKFWVGSPVAWLAFFVSMGTAYFNLIRTSDDLKVVVSNIGFYPEKLDDESPTLSINFTATFANSGNRPIVVHSSRLLIDQWDDRARGCEQFYWNVPKLEFKMKPFVVKPNEIAVETIKTQPLMQGDSDFQRVETNKRFDYSALNRVLTCLQFSIVSPDGLVESPVYSLMEVWTPRESDGAFRRLSEENEPMQLLSSRLVYTTWLHSVSTYVWSRILRLLPVPYDWDRNWSLDPPI